MGYHILLILIILSFTITSLTKKICGNDDDKVSLATAGNLNYWQGMLTAIHSVFRHSAKPECIEIHIYIPSIDIKPFSSDLQKCLLPINDGNTYIHPINPSNFTLGRPELGSEHILNFIRFYLPSLLPHTSKVLWIDTDLVVRGDVQLLIKESFINDNYNDKAIRLHHWAIKDLSKIFKRDISLELRALKLNKLIKSKK